MILDNENDTNQRQLIWLLLINWSCPQTKLMFWLMTKLSKTESTQHFALCLLLTDKQKRPAFVKIAKDLQMTLWRSTSFAVLEFCLQSAYEAKLANKRKVYGSRMPLAHGCSISDLLCIVQPAWQQSCFCLVSSSMQNWFIGKST